MYCVKCGNIIETMGYRRDRTIDETDFYIYYFCEKCLRVVIVFVDKVDIIKYKDLDNKNKNSNNEVIYI